MYAYFFFIDARRSSACLAGKSLAQLSFNAYILTHTSLCNNPVIYGKMTHYVKVSLASVVVAYDGKSKCPSFEPKMRLSSWVFLISLVGSSPVDYRHCDGVDESLQVLMAEIISYVP